MAPAEVAILRSVSGVARWPEGRGPSRRAASAASARRVTPAADFDAEDGPPSGVFVMALPERHSPPQRWGLVGARIPTP